MSDCSKVLSKAWESNLESNVVVKMDYFLKLAQSEA